MAFRVGGIIMEAWLVTITSSRLAAVARSSTIEQTYREEDEQINK
jgi:hypothetical protein